MALFGSAAAVAMAYIYLKTDVLLSRRLEQTIDAEIRGLAEHYRGHDIGSLAETVASRSQVPGNSLYRLTYADYTYIAGNLGAVPEELLQPVEEPIEFLYKRVGDQRGTQRLARARVFQLRGGYRLLVGRDIEDRREFSRVMRSAFLWGLGVMALVGLGGGWLVSRSLLARIDEVTATSRTIMAGDLSGRVPVYGTGDELDRLSENLNAMLERIEQLMTGLQEVSDNIAHDLKTPLNRLRNRVEAALRQADGEAVYRDALERTIEEADDLIKTFNALLSIARLEAGAVRETMTDIDVGTLVRDVAELYEPAAEDQGLELRSRVSKDLHVAGDRQLLGQAVANLVDNAIKYGFSGTGAKRTGKRQRGSIRVVGRRQDGKVEISVADTGLGVPEAERERVLKRFVRLEEARSRPGSGLGLSLVAAVARLHGGLVRLEDNKPGLKAVLSLPASNPAGEVDKAP
jgi:signal transduction histidine kinase